MYDGTSHDTNGSLPGHHQPEDHPTHADNVTTPESSIPMQTVIEALERREHPSKLVHQYATNGTPVVAADTDTDGAGTDEEGGN